MRLIFFCLLLVPTVSLADKATRDQLLEILTETYSCTGYILPWGEDALLTSEDKKLVNKIQLILQFEHDEEFFSVENLVRLKLEFGKKFEEQYPIIDQLSEKLSESEKQYLGLKIANLNPMAPADKASDIIGFWPKDIKLIAKNIKECAKKYSLY